MSKLLVPELGKMVAATMRRFDEALAEQDRRFRDEIAVLRTELDQLRGPSWRSRS